MSNKYRLFVTPKDKSLEERIRTMLPFGWQEVTARQAFIEEVLYIHVDLNKKLNTAKLPPVSSGDIFIGILPPSEYTPDSKNRYVIANYHKYTMDTILGELRETIEGYTRTVPVGPLGIIRVKSKSFTKMSTPLAKYIINTTDLPLGVIEQHDVTVLCVYIDGEIHGYAVHRPSMGPNATKETRVIEIFTHTPGVESILLGELKTLGRVVKVKAKCDRFKNILLRMGFIEDRFPMMSDHTYTYTP